MARYRTIENIDLVEMDEQVVEACRMYLPESQRLDDERVHIYFDNALRFIRRRTDEYGLIIVDSTDPFGPSESYFTKEFYGICYNALHEDGILVNQQGSPFYQHDAEAMQRSHQRSSVHFQSAECIRHTSRPMRQDTGSLGFASKKISSAG